MALLAEETIHRFSREEYERLADIGGFDPETRVELLEGIVYDMSPQNSLHATAIVLLSRLLQLLFLDGHHLRIQLPLPLGRDSVPEPDLAVIPGDPRDFRDSHPTSAVLVVEVADHSLSYDHKQKIPIYARAGIAESWILNLVDSTLEVYRQPTGGAYKVRQVLRKGDVLSLLARPEAVIGVADLLP
jgi:Uma2 family endonuclease